MEDSFSKHLDVFITLRLESIEEWLVKYDEMFKKTREEAQEYEDRLFEGIPEDILHIGLACPVRKVVHVDHPDVLVDMLPARREAITAARQQDRGH